MDLSTRLRTLALRRISSREPFSATDLAAEAVGSAPTVDDLRSAYATAAEVCSDEFLHAAGYQRQVTPGGLRFEPIPTGPTRIPAIAYERAIPLRNTWVHSGVRGSCISEFGEACTA